MTPTSLGSRAAALLTIAGLSALAGAACERAEPPPPPRTIAADTSSATSSATSNAASNATSTAASNDDWLGPPPAFFACLTGDSATYSDVRIDTLSGDTTGVALTFWRAGDGIDGTVVQTDDPNRTPAPFLRIQLAAEDSIALDMLHPTELDTIRFLGRVSCTRLWGRQRNRREGPGRAALYTRSY